MAAARTLSGDFVFSHESAAAWWGFPRLGALPDVVSASFTGPHGRSARAGLRWHRAEFQDDDVVRVGTMRFTSPRRTAVDLARTGTLADGVIALDHVFARDVDRQQVLEWLGRARPFPGARRVSVALGLAHGRSESPLESLSLARFAELGIPIPEQQHEFLTARRQRFRVDFYWPGLDVIGECDGRLKYATPDDLWREKRREDALRPLARRFVRWSWADARDSEPLAALLASAGIR